MIILKSTFFKYFIATNFKILIILFSLSDFSKKEKNKKK